MTARIERCSLCLPAAHETIYQLIQDSQEVYFFFVTVLDKTVEQRAFIRKIQYSCYLKFALLNKSGVFVGV